uniref:ABC transporter G family member 32 n=1 Tax=Solanum tuberosum TaxID=4113 RepID=M0ZXV4_SOLTU
MEYYVNDFEDAMLRDTRKASSWIMEDSYSDYTLKVAIEFPYVFSQAIIYSTIFYSLAAFEWSASKILWYILGFVWYISLTFGTS